MAWVGEEFPLECPGCGGDIRLIAFITEPRPVRKILTPLGEPLEPPPISPARGPPTNWGELVQVHDDRNVSQATDRRAVRDRYRQPLTPAERQFTTKPSGGRTRRGSAPTPEKRHFRGESRCSGSRFWGPRDGSTRLTSLSAFGPCLRKCHWPGYPPSISACMRWCSGDRTISRCGQRQSPIVLRNGASIGRWIANFIMPVDI